MVSGLCYVAEEGGQRVEIVQNYVYMAIVEKVAEGRTAGANDGGEAATRGGGGLLEFLAGEIAKKERGLGVRSAPLGFFGDRGDLAVGDEGIEKSVVVEIEEARAPTQDGDLVQW